jgi:hypothetical protein
MNEPVPPPPGAPAQKQGMSTLVKVLIGCGVVLVLGVGSCVVVTGYLAKKGLGKIEEFAKEAQDNPDAALVRTTALALRLNPEIEVVSSDPGAGTIVVREKATGKQITFTVDDIKEGRLSISEGGQETQIDFDADEQGGGSVTVRGGDGGTMTMGAGDAGQVPGWVPGYPGARADAFTTVRTGAEASGSFTIHTSDSAETVLSFYEEKLKAAGFEVQRTTLETAGAMGGNLAAQSGARTLNVTVATQEGETQGLIAYVDQP